MGARQQSACVIRSGGACGQNGTGRMRQAWFPPEEALVRDGSILSRHPGSGNGNGVDWYGVRARQTPSVTHGGVTQLARVRPLQGRSRGFESHRLHPVAGPSAPPPQKRSGPPPIRRWSRHFGRDASSAARTTHDGDICRSPLGPSGLGADHHGREWVIARPAGAASGNSLVHLRISSRPTMSPSYPSRSPTRASTLSPPTAIAVANASATPRSIPVTVADATRPHDRPGCGSTRWGPRSYVPEVATAPECSRTNA